MWDNSNEDEQPAKQLNSFVFIIRTDCGCFGKVHVHRLGQLSRLRRTPPEITTIRNRLDRLGWQYHAETLIETKSGLFPFTDQCMKDLMAEQVDHRREVAPTLAKGADHETSRYWSEFGHLQGDGL